MEASRLECVDEKGKAPARSYAIAPTKLTEGGADRDERRLAEEFVVDRYRSPTDRLIEARDLETARDLERHVGGLGEPHGAARERGGSENTDVLRASSRATYPIRTDDLRFTKPLLYQLS